MVYKICMIQAVDDTNKKKWKRLLSNGVAAINSS